MKIRHKTRILIVISTFIVIIGVFLFSATIEYKRAVSEQKQVLQSSIQLLTAQVNQFVNLSIRNTMGVISYVQMKPDLTQEELSKFSKNLLPADDKIISHFTIIKDTTIEYVYPLEGNENAIGVDLATIEDQRDAILEVKNNRVSLFIGPVELVQGGRNLINRIPILLNPGTVEETYWGQLALVIKYEPMLEAAGINEFSKKYNIQIEQIQGNEKSQNVIYSNVSSLKEKPMETIINVPNGIWLIKAEYKNGYNGETTMFYILLFTGIVFAFLIAISVNNIFKSNIELNRLIKKRTDGIRLANESLKSSLEELRTTQEQLIMSEKLAALGGLVAGVAHEINTPLGVCVTVGSYINDTIRKLETKFNEKTLKQSELKSAISNIIESTDILVTNLDRASQLVLSFKQLATDQYIEERRLINFKNYVGHLLKSLMPTFRGTTHCIETDIDEDIAFVTYPGALSQILTNLIMNSLIHGFDGIENGKIKIKVEIQNDNIVLDYRDNGHGISEENASRIFEPFFTTKRNRGSTGLGLHIVYNIVFQKLNGTINLISGDSKGVHFQIVLPYEKEI